VSQSKKAVALAILLVMAGGKGLPRIFVGSSKESKKYAAAINGNLDEQANVTVWNQNVFKLTKTALESLVEQLSETDYAIFVFAPDDVLKLRKEKFFAVRDNIIFELGLFMGRLGRDRTFIVAPRNGKKLRIPSDLFGLTMGTFNANREDRKWRSALGPFCDEVMERIASDRAKKNAKKKHKKTSKKTP
jgi:predicted nucleotide-binding protein